MQNLDFSSLNQNRIVCFFHSSKIDVCARVIKYILHKTRIFRIVAYSFNICELLLFVYTPAGTTRSPEIVNVVVVILLLFSNQISF